MPDSHPNAEANPNGATCSLQRDKLVPKFCEVIPSTLAALDLVQAKVMAVVKALPCSEEEIDHIELALREALANAVVHGNKADPAKKVVVACFCECESGGGLLLVVRDEGSGFDPAAVPDPSAAEMIGSSHGRGIFLMRQFLDEVNYRDRGRQVELRKRRK